MTLVQLEYIIALDIFRHFVKAAAHCHVTQPTLSMQIKKFEEEMNVLIFDRNKQPIEPTAIGKKIIEQAQSVLKGQKQIQELIDESRTQISGEIRIGIIPTIAVNLSSLLLSALVSKFPDMQVFVEELMTHQVIDKMRKGQIDIGIVATPISEEGLVEIPVYYEPFVLYVSEKHKLYEKSKISSRDLKIEEMWLLTDGHCFRNHIINLCEATNTFPEKMKFGYSTGSLEVLMQFVDSNYGYTLLPYLSTLNLKDDKKHCIREFKEPTPKREISIITTDSYIKEKLVETLKTEIRNSIPKELKYLDSGKLIKWK